MAKTVQKADLKSWKRKFLGVTTEGGVTKEDLYAQAQKLINIFRQMPVLNKEAKDKFENMVADMSSETEEILWLLPGGKDVLGFRAYIQEKRGTLIEEEESLIDDKEMEAEKARAKIIADAISLSQSKTVENLQKQSMQQVEQLNKVLQSAQNNGGGGGGVGGVGGGMVGGAPNVSGSQAPAGGSSISGSIDAITPAQVEITGAPPPSVTSQAAPVAIPIQVTVAATAAPPAPVQSLSPVEGANQIPTQGPALQTTTPPVASGTPPLSSLLPTDISHTISEAILTSLTEANRETSKALANAVKEAVSTAASSNSVQAKELGTALADAVKEAVTTANSSTSVQTKELGNALAQSQEKTGAVIASSLKEVFARPDPAQGFAKQITDVFIQAQTKSDTNFRQIAAFFGQNQQKSDANFKQLTALLSQNQQTTNQILAKNLEVMSRSAGMSNIASSLPIMPDTGLGSEAAEVIGKSVAGALAEGQKSTSAMITRAINEFTARSKEKDDGARQIAATLAQSQEKSAKIIYAALNKIAEKQDKNDKSDKIIELLLQMQEKNTELLASILDKVTVQQATLAEAKTVVQPESKPASEDEYEYEYEYVVVDEDGNEISVSSEPPPELGGKETKTPQEEITEPPVLQPSQSLAASEPENKAELRYFETEEDEDIPASSAPFNYLAEEALKAKIRQTPLGEGISASDLFDDNEKSDDMVWDENVATRPVVPKQEKVSGNLENILPVEALKEATSTTAELYSLPTAKKQPSTTQRIDNITVNISLAKPQNQPRRTNLWLKDNSRKLRQKTGPYIIFAKAGNDNERLRIDLGRVA